MFRLIILIFTALASASRLSFRIGNANTPPSAMIQRAQPNAPVRVRQEYRPYRHLRDIRRNILPELNQAAEGDVRPVTPGSQTQARQRGRSGTMSNDAEPRNLADDFEDAAN